VVFEPPLYLDACATTPLTQAARLAMDQAQDLAWGNPSSLHGFGLAALESLERSRWLAAELLGTTPEAVHFCSGATESVHLALLGLAEAFARPARLVISAVEHPALNAAAEQLRRRGWQVSTLPVDATGRVLLEPLQELLQPPTRLVSVIGAQSEVGTVQPMAAIASLCRAAGVLLHSDAVQLVPQQPLLFDASGIDLLTLTAHKLGGPRGIGALLVRPACLPLLKPVLGGGSQEQGLRSGTEAVVLAAGFAAALQQRVQWLASDQANALRQRRDVLLAALLAIPGLQLSGPDPAHQERLPHHISLTAQSATGQALSGRRLVRALWHQGVAASSGSACSSGAGDSAASPVLLAMGYEPAQAAAGLRFSLLPDTDAQQLRLLPAALQAAMAACC